MLSKHRSHTLALDSTTVATYKYLGPRVLQRNYPVPDVTYDISYNNLAQATRHRSHIDSTDIANFAYSFDDNGNITNQTFDHRTSSPYNEYTYDNLDRLVRADYLSDPCDNEQFTLDDLGNRTNVNLRSGADETYVVDETTNRYNTVGGNNLDYDAAGNMTLDPNDYTYQYDFENRMITITKNETTIAEFAYDALGRRIEQYDAVADETMRYYYDGWRVLAEFDDTETQLRDYVYGNYLDEVLCKTENGDTLYYVHDHLYSPVALVDAEGTVVERYEYDAYGKRYVFDSSFNARNDTLYNNSIAFTGQQLYILDNGNLSGMHYNARDYTPPLGRFLQHDPQGMIPEGIYGIEFYSIAQFGDGMNLYEYVQSQPLQFLDPEGLSAGKNDKICCKTEKEHSEFVWIGFGVLEGMNLRTWTTCKQETVSNPQGLTPSNACRCHYEKVDPKSKVYNYHEGSCRWCDVYLRWDKGAGTLPVIRELKHGGLVFVCGEGDFDWTLDAYPNKDVSQDYYGIGTAYYDLGTGNKYHKDRDREKIQDKYFLGKHKKYLGRISAEVAEKWRIKLDMVSKRWVKSAHVYSTVGMNCHGIATEIADQILDECP